MAYRERVKEQMRDDYMMVSLVSAMAGVKPPKPPALIRED